MTLILKSNQTFTGPSVPIDAIEYEDRVLAEGGVINDRQAMLEAFNWIRDNNITPAQTESITSARWGVKKYASGNVEVLFDLFGPAGDMIVAQDGAYKLEGAGETSRIRASTSYLARAASREVVSSPERSTIAVVFEGPRGRVRHVATLSKDAAPSSSNGWALLLAVDDSGYYADTLTGSAVLSSFAPYEAYGSVVVRDTGDELQGILGGEVVATTAKSTTPYSAPCKFYLGSNTGGAPLYGAYAEQWCLHDLSEAQALALSSRMASLY